MRGGALKGVAEYLNGVEVNLVRDRDVDEEHLDGLLVHLDADKEALDGTQSNLI